MGIDRKTVGRHLSAIAAAGVGDATEVDDGVLSGIGQAVQQRPAVVPSPVWQALERECAQVEAWLVQKPPLRLTRVHEVIQRKGVAAGYTTRRRYVEPGAQLEKRELMVRMADPPLGEEAQVDFGQIGMLTSSDSRRRKLWVLIMELSCSRYEFIWPTFELTTEEVCAGLDAAGRFFDGVVKRLVPDNPTSMVLRVSLTEPELNRAFREYADARGFFIDPAQVQSRQDKARVENQVPYVRERWFAGETLPLELCEIRRHELSVRCSGVSYCSNHPPFGAI